MMFMSLHRKNLASLLFKCTGKARISFLSHLTAAEQRLYWEHEESKSRLPPKPIRQMLPLQQLLLPQIYSVKSSAWLTAEDDYQTCLRRGSVLEVVSWNMDWSSPGEADRAVAALGHLQKLFGTVPGQLVIMLQEVCNESLQAILENSWVRQNFILTNVDAPKPIYIEDARESFILRVWNPCQYFTLMMIPRSLRSLKCFRVPFTTLMGREALFVDIPISTEDGRTRSNACLRLCTTHLESLWAGRLTVRVN